MTKSITKAERQELRGVVRQQFRVLRHEVQARSDELIAEGEQRILDSFRAADQRRYEIDEEVQHLLGETLDKIREVCRDRPDAGIPKHINMGFGAGSGFVAWAPDRRGELRSALYTLITSRTASALLQLDRQEADLLRNLAVGALESDAAHAFLTTIPTVAELVPEVRLAELEAQFSDQDHPEE